MQHFSLLRSFQSRRFFLQHFYFMFRRWWKSNVLSRNENNVFHSTMDKMWKSEEQKTEDGECRYKIWMWRWKRHQQHKKSFFDVVQLVQMRQQMFPFSFTRRRLWTFHVVKISPIMLPRISIPYEIICSLYFISNEWERESRVSWKKSHILP